MFEVGIRTTKETKEMLSKFPEDTRKALVNAMFKASKFLEAETKKSFGKFGYPRVRTGHLRRSIYSKAYERASNVIGLIGTEVIYGKFLEEGTRRMKARPFLRPTVKRNEDKLAVMINNSIARELNK